MSGFGLHNSSFQVSPNQNPDNGSETNPAPTNPSSFHINPQTSIPSEEESLYSSENGDFYYATLKYINDMLLEEDLDDKPYMPQDSLALQAAEKSFYDVLGEKYPHFDQNIECPDDHFVPSSSIDCSNRYPPAANSAEPNWICCQAETEPVQSSRVNTPEIPCLVPGLLPFRSFNDGIPYSCHESSFQMVPSGIPEMIARESERTGARSLRVRKSYQSKDGDYADEGRRNKQPLATTEEAEQLEIIDNSFMQRVENKEPHPLPLYDKSRNEASKKLQQNEQLQASYMRMKRLDDKNERVDLWTLLTQCAQAVGSGDQRTANEKLQQIRQHVSPLGDGNERMAYYFANGLEARLNGTGRLLRCSPSSMRNADILKAHQLYASVCPFRKMTNMFSNRTISKAGDKAERLHIIDFGISYGFQWPCFITRLSMRPGGPPMVRITGIDLPQSGFRPAERVEETGRRLKRVADAMNVPFEYNAIAQKWETIRLEDLKIEKDEVIVVNCMYRMKNLIDDTLVLNSPRDTVLRLIKSINPDIFIHGVVNGSFNAPFFVTRFREAIFHYSALFDMFEANTPREDQERLVFEREMIGNDAINVIACEGVERVERPETYKQWQVRNSRIGFTQLPLHQDVMKRLRRGKGDYHKNFVVDEDGNWVLMGWKGRTILAISAWKPIRD